jgi:NADH:ubiquinone reductase (H+-translocating)
VHLARVRAINVAEKWIASERVRLRFEYLVLACGARHGYFGDGEWEQHAPGLKTLEQAVEMRRRLLQAFEMAENELGPATLRVLLTFVVVGGGPTGVELAGAIADISRTVLLRDFRRIDPSCSSVVLLEAAHASSRRFRRHSRRAPSTIWPSWASRSARGRPSRRSTPAGWKPEENG